MHARTPTSFPTSCLPATALIPYLVTNQNCVALLMDAHLKLPENGPKQTDAPWCIVPITPVISSQISICYRNDKPLSKNAQLFVDLCNDNLFT